MVSLADRSGLLMAFAGDDDTRFAYQLIFGKPVDEAAKVSHPSNRLAYAIANSDEALYRSVVDDLQRRQIRPNSDWILNDFLVFCLLVGKTVFNCDSGLVEQLFNARSPVGNPLAARIEAVFLAIHTGARSIEGDLSFVKLVFCDLADCLELQADGVKSVYQFLTEQHELKTFPPLLQMLAYRAFDLVVTRSIERKLGTAEEVVQAFESKANELSVSQSFRIIGSLRPGTLWTVGVLLAALVTSAFAFGRLVESNNHPKIEGEQVINSSN